MHRDFEGNIKSETTLFTKNNPNTTFSNLETFNVLVSYNYTFSNITKGDTLTLYTYIYVNIANDPLNSKDANLKNKIYTDSYFKVVGNSIEEDTVHKIPRLKDVFSKIVDFVTDNKVSVSMPEFEVGGEYYNYFLTNGYEIRKADEVEDEERQFVYDFKRAIESLNTLFMFPPEPIIIILPKSEVLISIQLLILSQRADSSTILFIKRTVPTLNDLDFKFETFLK